MFSYQFPMCSAAATMVIIYNNTVLLGLRGNTDTGYSNYWALPGGFLNAQGIDTENAIHNGETIEETAIRETFEETNIKISKDQLQLFHIGSNQNYQTNIQVINACYIIKINDDQAKYAKAGDDLLELKWLNFFNAKKEKLAFDHNFILNKGLDIAIGKKVFICCKN